MNQLREQFEKETKTTNTAYRGYYQEYSAWLESKLESQSSPLTDEQIQEEAERLFPHRNINTRQSAVYSAFIQGANFARKPQIVKGGSND